MNVCVLVFSFCCPLGVRDFFFWPLNPVFEPHGIDIPLSFNQCVTGLHPDLDPVTAHGLNMYCVFVKLKMQTTK